MYDVRRYYNRIVIIIPDMLKLIRKAQISNDFAINGQAYIVHLTSYINKIKEIQEEGERSSPRLLLALNVAGGFRMIKITFQGFGHGDC
jgi:hypothetical protein